MIKLIGYSEFSYFLFPISIHAYENFRNHINFISSCFYANSKSLILFPTSVETDNSNQSNPYLTLPIIPDSGQDSPLQDGLASEADIPFMADFTEMPEFYPETSAPGFGDSIDPSSRTLRIIHTDAILRTNGGLDIAVTRTYQSVIDSYFLKTKFSRFNNLNSAVGLGWQMHFGRVL